jgi:hypothetical protein
VDCAEREHAALAKSTGAAAARRQWMSERMTTTYRGCEALETALWHTVRAYHYSPLCFYRERARLSCRS